MSAFKPEGPREDIYREYSDPEQRAGLTKERTLVWEAIERFGLSSEDEAIQMEDAILRYVRKGTGEDTDVTAPQIRELIRECFREPKRIAA